MSEGLELEFNEKTKRIGILIAVMAAVLAFSEAAGQDAQADAIRETVETSDLWAFYQAKTIRMTTLESDAAMLELLAANAKGEQAQQAAAIVKQWRDAAKRYESEPDKKEGRKELAERAQEKQVERDRANAVNHTFDLTSGALEIGILLASTAVVTDILAFAFAGGAFGVIGLALAGFALWAPTVFG
ncbi:MAG: DUF4337 family protein [Alphaproteobacteria bacterium]|nr:DUF4337 family protein [Alphaproteobacteria bacterium]